MDIKYTPPRKKYFRGNKRNVSFRFPEDLMEYYEALASESGLTVTEVLIDVLDSTAEQIEKSRKKRT